VPNGFHGSSDTWDRIESPLHSLDPALDAFAQEHGLSVSRNARGWPDRSIRWGHPVNRLIQVFLESEDRLTWTLWACASEDRDAERYWRHVSLRKAVPIDEIASDLPALLNEAKRTLEAWSSSDLEFATEIGTPAV
jgi:hypothetical protein